MKLKINIVDAFTDKLFGGNSAAVIITDNWLDEALMQSIATENNLSETAFLLKRANNNYDIRWFSPITEIDFCGHATLASAHVVFNQFETLDEVIFNADAVGSMAITKQKDNIIEMCFPNRKPSPIADTPIELIEGLSIKPTMILKNEQAYFAIYDSEEDVLAVKQDPTIIAKLAPLDVVVTASSSNSDYDFVSRYFWPANGGDEDPVTGSIHTGLAPYWMEKMGKTNLVGYQASARGGILNCNVTDDKVYISGNAVAYLEGVLELS